MSRIVAPSHLDEDSADALHDHTYVLCTRLNRQFRHTALTEFFWILRYGITSDPLTQFSAAFSALIHDVDHSGVVRPLWHYCWCNEFIR